MKPNGKNVPEEASNSNPVKGKQANTGSPEPESPAFNKRLDGPNRPST